MGRLSKNDRKYAVSPRKARKLACPRCHCYPCGKVGACEPNAVRRNNNAAAYNNAAAERQYQEEHGGGGWGNMPKQPKKKTAPAKKKALTGREKRTIRQDAEAAFRAKNPTASDSAVKSAGTKAVKKVGGGGCVVVAVMLLGGLAASGWGIIEAVHAVFG